MASDVGACLVALERELAVEPWFGGGMGTVVEPSLQAAWSASGHSSIMDGAATEPGQPSTELLDRIRGTFERLRQSVNAELVGSVGGVFCVCVTENGMLAQRWILDLKAGEGSVAEASEAEVGSGAIDCTITLSSETVRQWFNKEVDPMTALMNGLLSVEGDQMKMMSLVVLGE